MKDEKGLRLLHPSFTHSIIGRGQAGWGWNSASGACERPVLGRAGRVNALVRSVGERGVSTPWWDSPGEQAMPPSGRRRWKRRTDGFVPRLHNLADHRLIELA